MGRLLPLVVLAVLALAGVARADGPLEFTTVRLPDIDGSGTEPRITVGPDDTRWAITSTKRPRGNSTVVYKSRDGGVTWQPTVSKPAQTAPSIDVDVVAMPNGRILASELDYGGLNFPSSVTDDNGTTWTESNGSTKLADEDRQWFAVGPDTDKDGKPNVYLLWHNLGSGEASHNMFVATSTDGGQTFGPPVQTTVPGEEAYADLQCADSGGPSDIAVNPHTGRIYVFFTTRSGNQLVPEQNFGGCAAQPFEFNIVNATRVWVATSPDGTPGSWKQSLAVDDSGTGQIVSMQLAYGALDNQGGVWVAYPESPKPYPELGGAAVELRYQKPPADGVPVDGKWSSPLTLVPASDPKAGGANLVHLAVGDPGKIAVAYYRGITVPGQDKPIWYTHVVHSLDALSASPTIVDQRVSDVPTHKWTASEMMGLCADPSDPAQGIENGLNCDRSTDVWGIALDGSCRVSLVWPTAGTAQAGATKGVPGSAPGTYVSTQTGGPDLCGSQSAPGAPSAGAFLPPPGVEGSAYSAAPGGCVDTLAPVSRFHGHVRATRRGLDVRGTSVDRACVGGRAGQRSTKSLRVIRVAVGRRLADRKCRFLLGSGAFGPERSCLRTVYLSARGRSSWSFAIRTKLRRGRYLLWVRGIDAFGNIERKSARRNLARFSVR
jgi:hypothetical protein